MAKIGSLYVDLMARTARFANDFKLANGIVGKFQRQTSKALKSVTSKIFSLKGAAVSLVGAAGLGALVAMSFTTGDALAKTSDKLGVQTEMLAGLRHAGKLTGVQANTLDMALQRMTRRLSEAAIGTGEAQGAIKELGLDAQQLAAMSPDQAFTKIAGAMENVTTQGDKVRLSFKLFDSEGVALANTLALGKAGLEAAGQEADALGLAISRVDAAKIEEANNSFTRIKGVATGLGNAIAANVAPYITALGERFVKAAREAGGMGNLVGKAMDLVVAYVGFAADQLRRFQIVWLVLKSAALGVISSIVTALDLVNKAGVAAFNWIPGVDVQAFKPLTEGAEILRYQLEDTNAEIMALYNAAPASETFKTWSQGVQAEAQAAAEAVAKTKAGMAGGGEVSAGTGLDSKLEAAEAAALSKSIDAVQQSLLTKEQRILESYERQMFMAETAFQNQQISEEYKNQLLAGLAKQHEDQKTAIAQKGERDRRSVMAAGLGAASNIFSGLSSLMGREGKKQNAMQKTLAKAGIIASTAQAVMNALAVPPYPLGLALAAGAAIEGANQLRQVGGGGAISAPVSSPSFQENQSQPIPTSTSQSTNNNVQELKVTVEWANATPDQIDQLATGIARNHANGGASPVAA